MIFAGCVALAVVIVGLGWALCRIAAPVDYPDGEDE